MKKKIIGLVILFSVIGLLIGSTNTVQADFCDINDPDYCNPDGDDN